jgi:hypothetical protein
MIVYVLTGWVLASGYQLPVLWPEIYLCEADCLKRIESIARQAAVTENHLSCQSQEIPVPLS